MIVRVLGSAAGGGVPQWNCACANCAAARAGLAPRRSQSGFAISRDGSRWWLINCSPDIAQQIEATPALAPRSARGTPIAGMLFTDANVDHLGGLAVLRQQGAHAFTLFSSDVVRELASAQRAFSPFVEPPHRWLPVAPNQRFALEPGLEATVIPIGGATPGFDGRRPHARAVTAYEIVEGSNGARVVFAPVYPAIDPALHDALARADTAFLDGSFWSDDELGEVDVDKTARSLGHLPMDGAGGSLDILGGLPRNERFFAHLNNTNPVLNPRSPEAARVRDAGFSIAHDGLTLER